MRILIEGKVTAQDSERIRKFFDDVFNEDLDIVFEAPERLVLVDWKETQRLRLADGKNSNPNPG